MILTKNSKRSSYFLRSGTNPDPESFRKKLLNQRLEKIQLKKDLAEKLSLDFENSLIVYEIQGFKYSFDIEYLKTLESQIRAIRKGLTGIY